MYRVLPIVLRLQGLYLQFPQSAISMMAPFWSKIWILSIEACTPQYNVVCPWLSTVLTSTSRLMSFRSSTTRISPSWTTSFFYSDDAFSFAILPARSVGFWSKMAFSVPARHSSTLISDPSPSLVSFLYLQTSMMTRVIVPCLQCLQLQIFFQLAMGNQPSTK